MVFHTSALDIWPIYADLFDHPSDSIQRLKMCVVFCWPVRVISCNTNRNSSKNLESDVHADVISFCSLEVASLLGSQLPEDFSAGVQNPCQ